MVFTTPSHFISYLRWKADTEFGRERSGGGLTFGPFTSFLIFHVEVSVAIQYRRQLKTFSMSEI